MTRSRFLYDSELALRPIGSPAITATANSAAVELLRANAVANSGFAHQDLAVVVNVSAIDSATGDETYVLTVEADTSAAFGSPVEVARLTVKDVGRQVVILDGDTVEKAEPGVTHLRVKATLGGTTPSLTYSAYLAPNRP